MGNKGHFDEFGTYLLAPIRISDSLVRGYYAGITCTQTAPLNVTIGLAESYDDGTTFQKIGVGPVFSHAPHDPFVVSSQKIRRYNDKYYLFYTSGTEWLKNSNGYEPIYKLKVAVSDDGISWVRSKEYLIEDKLETEAQACPDVFYYEGGYHMFFCYRGCQDYRKNVQNSYKIGYAYSDDLMNWTRDDNQIDINTSVNKADFDYEMVAYPHVFELDGKLYMLYVGNEVGRYGFGLSELEFVR